MQLSPGDKLGPYEIIAPIGAGGMGELYEARYTRLDRTVAVKLLPEHIAKREDLRARFELEARAAFPAPSMRGIRVYLMIHEHDQT